MFGRDPGSRRSASPLCDEEFRKTWRQIPRPAPPNWLRRGTTGSISLTLLLAAAVLVAPVEEFVAASGVVVAGDYTVVFSKENGLLANVDVEDGETVARGQVLATLEATEPTRRLALIEGEIEETRVELSLARSSARKVAAVPVPPEFLFSGVEVERQREIQALQQNYLSRLEELERSGAASGVELLNLRLQLIATEAMLKRSRQANELLEGEYGQAAAEEARERVRLIESRLAKLEAQKEFLIEEIGRLTVTAPRSGEILAVTPALPGERIQAGEPLFKISHGESKELRLFAGEDRIDRIRPGLRVRFRANNNPDRLAPLATGAVVEVARDLELDSKTLAANRPSGASYRVKVRIEEQPYPLAIGAGVDAEIVLGIKPFYRLLLQR